MFKMPWASIDRFLSSVPSRGPNEAQDPHSEFTHYDSADADILTLLSILKRDHSLHKVACVPDRRLCLHTDGSGRAFVVETSRGSCPSAAPGTTALDIRAGIVLTGSGEMYRTGQTDDASLFLPPGWKRGLDECERKGVLYVVANFGLYMDTLTSNGHANALVFNLHQRLIERFEPAGRQRANQFDKALESLFRSKMPGWKYVGSSVAPNVGPQRKADAFSGLCVTWSLYYVILRLTNPQKTTAQINQFMVRGTKSELKSRLVRLNKYMADTLRSHPRGSLS